jgi:hypothetical protein
MRQFVPILKHNLLVQTFEGLTFQCLALTIGLADSELLGRIAKGHVRDSPVNIYPISSNNFVCQHWPSTTSCYTATRRCLAVKRGMQILHLARHSAYLRPGPCRVSAPGQVEVFDVKQVFSLSGKSTCLG